MKLILDVVNDLISESKSDDKIIIKALNLLLANYKDHLSLMDRKGDIIDIQTPIIYYND